MSKSESNSDCPPRKQPRLDCEMDESRGSCGSEDSPGKEEITRAWPTGKSFLFSLSLLNSLSHIQICHTTCVLAALLIVLLISG